MRTGTYMSCWRCHLEDCILAGMRTEVARKWHSGSGGSRRAMIERGCVLQGVFGEEKKQKV